MESKLRDFGLATFGRFSPHLYRVDGWLPPHIGGWVASFHFATILVPHSYSKPLQPIAMRLVGLFCFSSVYECKHSPQPQNKKACHFVTGFVIRIGFEPMTYCLEGSCSIQLSYRTRSFQLEVQNKDNLTLIQRKRALNQSVAIKSLITTLAAVHPNIAGI